MAKLDELVTARLSDQLVAPERVGSLLLGLFERQAAKDTDCTQRLAPLRDKRADTERKLSRLYDAIENGIADPSDPKLKARIAAF